MAVDIESLAAFYKTPQGEMAQRLVLSRVRLAWPSVSGLRVLGYGFAAPYLFPFHGDAERAVAAVPCGETSPGAQAEHAACWLPTARNASALVDETALPFPDAMFDRILMVHGLENCEAERPFMREIWRVLAPEGRVIMVVPNRASLWSQFETTPFASGRPYTRIQLARLLEQSLFAAEGWDAALMLPPFFHRTKRRQRPGTPGWERLGHRFWPGLAGVHIVEATKSLYAAMPGKPQSGLRRRVLATERPTQRSVLREGPE
jgi:SAM-dependent methyltransferase